MKPVTVILGLFILVSAGAIISPAQEEAGFDSDYTCWMCPDCDYIARLDVQIDENAVENITTLAEVIDPDEYDPDSVCLECGCYMGYFVLISCPIEEPEEEVDIPETDETPTEAGNETITDGDNVGWGDDAGVDADDTEAGNETIVDGEPKPEEPLPE
jgi:hypothetical protein